MHSVISLITSKSCLSRSLAAHFGDEDSIPATPAGCANCTFCITKTPIVFPNAYKYTLKKEEIDEKKIEVVLAATSARDDARFLTRIAFGITSPRVKIERLGKHRVFGSCSGCDFEVSFFVLRWCLSCVLFFKEMGRLIYWNYRSSLSDFAWSVGSCQISPCRHGEDFASCRARDRCVG